LRAPEEDDMVNHYAPLDPEQTDTRYLNRREILRLNDFGAQFGFGLSVLEARGFFRPQAPPMLTWPFLDFVDGLDLGHASLLELGAGESTIWFSSRFSRVRSIETNPEWFRALSARVAPNVELAHADLLQLENAEIPYHDEDWILVDFAGRRTRFLSRFFSSAARTSKPAVVVLDNADWYRAGAAILQQNEYLEIPFYGFKSGQSWISCTSVFLDPSRCRLRQRDPFFQPPFSRSPSANRWDTVE
jgi:hypothetical protein